MAQGQIRRLMSWGSQMELAEELKMASALSLPTLESSAAPAGDTELCSVFHPEREADAGTIQL